MLNGLPLGLRGPVLALVGVYGVLYTEAVVSVERIAPVCTPCAKPLALNESTSVSIPISRVMANLLLARGANCRSEQAEEHEKCHVVRARTIRRNGCDPIRGRCSYSQESNLVSDEGRARGS